MKDKVFLDTAFVIASAIESDAFHNKALELLNEIKTLVLVDCISFVTMKQLGIAESLTTDLHFQQAGFAALLR